MEVLQLVSLARFFDEKIKGISKAYQTLHEVLSHNATQPNKQVVREPLEKLLRLLTITKLSPLTNEQIDLLQELEVSQFLGPEGAEFVKATVMTSEYDPASAASDIEKARNKISETHTKLTQLQEALAFLGAGLDNEPDTSGLSIVRVRFKEKASISDMPSWKRWAAEWHDIARGVAMCAGESPNDVKVLGATNGSVILVLATTATVSLFLATIAKNISTIILNVLQVSEAIEEFRHKRVLNGEIEDALRKRQNEMTEHGVDIAVDAIKKEMGGTINGDVETALRKAVEKYLAFSDKGGDVDFLPPKEEVTKDTDNGAPDEAEQEAVASELRQLRETVELLRSEQQQIRLLSHRRDDSL